MSELTQEQANAEALKIVSNPENATKEEYKPIFEKARELGLVDENGNLKQEATQPQGMLQSIKERFGDYDSEESFFREVEKWKGNAEINVNTFSSLPQPLFNAIQKHLQGQDWTQEVQGSKLLDVNRNYSDKELVQFYSPIQFTEEEWNDSENLAIKKAVSQSKQAFQLDKQAKANEAQLAKTRQEQAVRVANESADRSIASLKKYNPNLSDNQAARIKKALLSGEVNSLFIDAQGRFTEDAAANLFPLLFSEDYKKLLAKPLTEQAGKQVEDILNRGGQPRESQRKPVPTQKDNQTIVKNLFNEKRESPFKLTQ